MGETVAHGFSGPERIVTAWAPSGRLRRLLGAEVLLALAAFGVLCVVVLAVAPRLVEPDAMRTRPRSSR